MVVSTPSQELFAHHQEESNLSNIATHTLLHIPQYNLYLASSPVPNLGSNLVPTYRLMERLTSALPAACW
ncbi:hypothetical protein BGX38DRAFT_1161494 [Terfezia claveryi]|nr:hypothetical protein BGX38DRAFT_1161494 [Terfezia claveryi]